MFGRKFVKKASVAMLSVVIFGSCISTAEAGLFRRFKFKRVVRTSSCCPTTKSCGNVVGPLGVVRKVMQCGNGSCEVVTPAVDVSVEVTPVVPAETAPATPAIPVPSEEAPPAPAEPVDVDQPVNTESPVGQVIEVNKSDIASKPLFDADTTSFSNSKSNDSVIKFRLDSDK